jgi:D-alanyl-D-alanine carboxypeptidase/D-alanyl-D-alanine-endopeptidase (penicillin-binding protein 4)
LSLLAQDDFRNEFSVSDSVFLLEIPESTENWLRPRLDRVTDDPLLQTVQLGMMVYDLTEQRPLYRWNERYRMRPASVEKVITSVTALDMLGTDYKYHTYLRYTGTVQGDTLHGNLYCVGGFDPTLTRSTLVGLADSLHKAGIRCIEGKILADKSMKDTLMLGSGWCWDDPNPTLSPLLVDKKDRFVQEFRTVLASRGFTLDVALGQGRCPQGAVEVADVSTPILLVLERMMKESDNLYAESMFYHVAAGTHSMPVKAADGERAVKQLIQRMGYNAAPYSIADGSGLSPYDFLTPEIVVAFLRYAYNHPSFYSYFYQSLPIAGRDGTLQNRMKKGREHGNVHAKTGTVTGVSTLAGYCRAANGHQLCFAIFCQGQQRASDARAFQDKICAAMCR